MGIAELYVQRLRLPGANATVSYETLGSQIVHAAKSSLFTFKQCAFRSTVRCEEKL